MKKHFGTVLCLFIAFCSFAQTQQVHFETDKFEVTLSPGLPLFYDAENDAPGLIDKETGAALLQIGDAKTKRLIEETTFTFNLDNFPFPVSGTVNTDSSSALPALSLVTLDTIEYHKNNVGTPGYVVPAQIANWPAQGDTSIGEYLNVAPFIDVNNNEIYDPENGDYPDIIGDIAAFSIMHYGNQWENLEIYFTVYAFLNSNAPALENTLFMSCEYRVTDASRDHKWYVSKGLNI